MENKIKSANNMNKIPEKVWSIRNNIYNYPAWNPFIKSKIGEIKVGNKIAAITVCRTF